MPALRKRIDTWLEQLAYFIFKHRFATLGIMLALIGFFAFYAAKLHSDTSLEGLLHKKDPILLDYNGFRDQFGREELIIVAVKTTDVFNMTFLKKLSALHNDLAENVPLLEKVSSLINARHTYGRNDELVVRDLFDPWPQSQADLAAIKARVEETPSYMHTFISEDGTYATILIQTRQYSGSDEEEDLLSGFAPSDMSAQNGSPKYLTDEENSTIAKAVNQIIEKYDAPGFHIFLGGSPSVTHTLKVALFRDMTLFTTLSILTISIFLYLMFRRISGVVLPLIVVNTSMVSTFGIMSLCGAILKIPFTILPSFLLTVGVGDAVHILVFFFRNFNQTGKKDEAIARALSHCGLALILTSITTAAGLLSFLTAEIAPVADLGLYAAMGVIIALIYTIVFLPALLSVIPLKPKNDSREQRFKHVLERILRAFGKLAVRKTGTLLFISAILICLAVLGTTQIRFFHNIVQWFPEDEPIRIGMDAIDGDLKGSISLEVVVNTGKENGVYDPGFLSNLDLAAASLETYREGKLFIGKVWSITTILKEINKALNNNQATFYTLPKTRELVAQELLLFENSGSDDLSDFVDSQYQKARMIIKVPNVDATQYSGFIQQVSDQMKERFPHMEVTTTGMMAILYKTITNLIKSMAESYIIAMLIITMLMIFLIGDFRLGLISMIPNTCPILIMLGLMGWLSIPMDMFSILVGSIAIGIVVDDTVHFMHNFKRNLDRTGDVEQALIETLLTTGPAMLVTSLVLATGFFMFMLSSMNNLFNFGLLTGITILFALLSDFLLGPALMVLVNRKTQIFRQGKDTN